MTTFVVIEIPFLYVITKKNISYIKKITVFHRFISHTLTSPVWTYKHQVRTFITVEQQLLWSDAFPDTNLLVILYDTQRIPIRHTKDTLALLYSDGNTHFYTNNWDYLQRQSNDELITYHLPLTGRFVFSDSQCSGWQAVLRILVYKSPFVKSVFSYDQFLVLKNVFFLTFLYQLIEEQLKL